MDRAELQCDGRASTALSDLSDSDSGSFRIHPCRNVHCCQLLEKQLGRIWHVDLRNLGLVLARPAFERILLQITTTSH